ncbi:STAS/SEC14 domain-containing protein [Arenibacter sp. TNZ]|uniref:STAS/SEC14 domain-containing protein n=1 Tax=Arenibacter TaxID=178469 RepID=UPI000CD3F939|nr:MULTISPECIES: STAS/SEC14 domain-containing protein [Arenibacter]MCM4172362.1 STAS/SEC14 domain-containing protein [Arenibacter sp. TNZ]
MENSTITISYKIKGVIDQEHINEFFEQMAAIGKKDRMINLVLEVYHIDGLRNVNKFFSEIKSKQSFLKHLRKFALIADADWIGDLVDFIFFLTPNVDVEVFDLDEREEANAWVNAPTKEEDQNLQERVKQGYAHLVHL